MTAIDETALFKAIRTIKGGGLTQAEVDMINRAIGVEVAAVVTSGFKTGAAGIALIHSFESCKLTAYRDPGSRNGLPITIGWGSTTDENGHPITLGTVWTQERADARFRADLAQREVAVNMLIAGGAPTTQNQFDALMSFAYNVGLDIDDDNIAEGLGDSTLLRKHRAGDYTGAQNAFAAWNKNDGKVLNGLVRRRAAEAALYGKA